jgi:2-polyprenyl-3-methyl-5-hydroxy-6-metoxy-1,4-benzoquinol methylase
MDNNQKAKQGKPYRGWEYAKNGDYHRNLDLNWSYAPTYLRKMKEVRDFLNNLRQDARILDAGCGEGILVEEYSRRGRLIEGIDLNYESEYVKRGNLLSLPYENGSFDAVLFLDVFEHLAFSDQPKALQEIKRVLKLKGNLLISAPNLAHLNSRVSMFFCGKLDRSDIETNHPGERPMAENTQLLCQNGFRIIDTKGITLTIPYLYRRIICRHAARLRWLHDVLDVLATPTLAMLNLFYCERDDC